MKKYLSKLVYAFVIIFLMGSCSYENIDFKTVENFKVNKTESKSLSLTFDVVVKNRNNFNVKIKPSSFDLFLNGKNAGTLKMDEKIKLPKNSKATASIPVSIELGMGTLGGLLKTALTQSLSVRIEGTAKVGRGILSKKIKINESKDFSLKDVKDLNLLNLLKELL